jgi:hypothetical protein
MTHAVLAFFIGASVLLSSSTWPGQTTRKTSEGRARDVYVSVLDSSGKPVPGLTAANFTVREDGVAREVLKAGPATERPSLAVLIDDSQAATSAIQFFRDGLTAFFKKLDGKADVALSTFGERPTPIVEYTDSTIELQKGVGRIFARSGAGAYMLEAISSVSKGLERRKAARPVIVAVVIDQGVEFSSDYYQPVLDALDRSGATLHVLAIGSPSSSQEDAMRNRNIVIAEGTSKSGGRRDQVLAESAITDKLIQVADELLNQYVVSYSRPETLIPPKALEVGVDRPGLTVRATKRAPGR